MGLTNGLCSLFCYFCQFIFQMATDLFCQTFIINHPVVRRTTPFNPTDLFSIHRVLYNRPKQFQQCSTIITKCRLNKCRIPEKEHNQNNNLNKGLEYFDSVCHSAVIINISCKLLWLIVIFILYSHISGFSFNPLCFVWNSKNKSVVLTSDWILRWVRIRFWSSVSSSLQGSPVWGELRFVIRSTSLHQTKRQQSTLRSLRGIWPKTLNNCCSSCSKGFSWKSHKSFSDEKTQWS